MASEIRVNQIQSRTGVSTISFTETGPIISGVTTITGDLDVTGLVSYDDVTNIDSVGIITARAGVKVPDSQKIILGAGNDLQIYHDGSNSIIKDNGTGKLILDTDGTAIEFQKQGLETIATFNSDGAVDLYHNNSKKFETTGVGASVTGAFNVGTGTSITSSSLIVNDVQYPTAGPLSNRNLVINGAMQVAQRGTSSQTNGYGSLDRWHIQWDGGTVTHTQTALTSGAPYDEGFRSVLRLTNTANTNDAAHYRNPFQYIEAQNLAQSGWDYTSSSSYVTLSFWVRSSYAQQFYGYLRTFDGTSQSYSFSMGTLSADTWTKVTKTIPGNSNITINNDSGAGLQLNIAAYWGGNFTSSGNTPETWGAFSSGSRTPDFSNSWANTTGATFDITGVQLEVGEKATPFEHRIYGDELARCQRYFLQIDSETNYTRYGIGSVKTSTEAEVIIDFPVTMRTRPTFSHGTMGNSTFYSANALFTSTNMNMSNETIKNASVNVINGGTMTAGRAGTLLANNVSAATDFYLAFSAEL